MNQLLIKVICIVLSATAAASCTHSTSSSSPFGPEFDLVSKLSPDFKAHANGSYIEITTGEGGRTYRGRHPGLTYRCAGREPEHFEFDGLNINSAPRVLSNRLSLVQKRYHAPPPPEDMVAVASNRSDYADYDAITVRRAELPSASPLRGIADYLTFPDGWLIAFDQGEFGGGLVWLPKQGVSFFLTKNNTRDLLVHGETIYTAEGLNHLSMTSGGIRSVQREEENGQWISRFGLYSAGTSVEKLAAHNEIVVGITDYGLVVVGPDKIVRYNAIDYRDSSNYVQRAQDVYIDDAGIIYVAGTEMLGVYDLDITGLRPQLYARVDCDFDYGAPPREEKKY